MEGKKDNNTVQNTDGRTFRDQTLESLDRTDKCCPGKKVVFWIGIFVLFVIAAFIGVTVAESTIKEVCSDKEREMLIDTHRRVMELEHRVARLEGMDPRGPQQDYDKPNHPRIMPGMDRGQGQPPMDIADPAGNEVPMNRRDSHTDRLERIMERNGRIDKEGSK